MHPDGVNDDREISSLILGAVNSTIKICQSSYPRCALSMPKIQAIMYLSEHVGDHTSIGDLAKQINSSLGWTSRITHQLVMEGLIDYVRDERDRRMLQVKLTEQGVSVARVISANLQRPISASLGKVQPKNRAAIAQFLRQFAAELSSTGVQISASPFSRKLSSK